MASNISINLLRYDVEWWKSKDYLTLLSY